MKHITFVFRDNRKGVHSIERLFSPIIQHLQADYACHVIRAPHKPSSILSIIKNGLYIRKNTKNKGIIHITGDCTYLAIFLLFRKVIITIHDIEYLSRLSGIKKLFYRYVWIKLPCLFSRKITVISEASKKDLESEIGSLGSKGVVIDNCLTINAERQMHKAFLSNCPKILQIGSARHKNLDTLIKAVTGLKCELHIVGQLAEENRIELERLKIRYTVEYDVPDSKILELYRECDILFFASRFEGFGLPILEAQAMGMPVITSNVYSIPYVAGEGAIIVDPESDQQIREAIQNLCDDSNLRQTLITRGYENVVRFLPETIAERYRELYESIS